MGTGAEFVSHRPQCEEGRVDEKFVRILFVEDRTDVADAIRGTLWQAGQGSFDIVRETDLVNAVAQISGEEFDLLLLDLSLADVERSTAIELANDLAHRLPVVVLTGTEGFDEIEVAAAIRTGLHTGIDQADLPGKVMSAIRRARRFGTGMTAPIFCRIDCLCG
jgi:DNA-binding NtrC family response regulator